MDAERARPRHYFSFRSPYSWLAWHDLRTGWPAVAELVRLIPFWEPDAQNARLLREAGATFPYTPMSRAKHLYILQDVRRLVVDRGLDVTWPVDRDPCWEVPHLAYLVAADQGCGPALLDRVYHARWHEGRDICDGATIADLAVELGLDPDRLAHAADDAAARAMGLEALLDVCREGVFGVPFFVNRFDRFWGVDRLPAFVASLGAADREQSIAAPGHEVVGAAWAQATDGGHAGGCG